jgi:hypothetical protein
MTFFQFLTLFEARWKSDSPTFFKKIGEFGVSLIATGTSMIGVSAINSVTLPPIISKIGAGLVIAGTCIGFVSKLTCADPSQLPVITETKTVVQPATPEQTTITQSGTATGTTVIKQ